MRTILNLRAALYGTIRRMHSVQRYSSLPVLRAENVAEHSWQVAMLSMLICSDLKHHGYADLRMDVVLMRALTHDLSESLSGDIIRSFKHSSPEIKRAIEDADDHNMVGLVTELVDGFGDLGVGNDVYYAWRDAKKGMEGEIVALADLLCVVSYCQEERALGSRKLDHVLKGAYDAMWRFVQQPTRFPWAQPYFAQVFPNGVWSDPYDDSNLNIRVDQPERS